MAYSELMHAMAQDLAALSAQMACSVPNSTIVVLPPGDEGM